MRALALVVTLWAWGCGGATPEPRPTPVAARHDDADRARAEVAAPAPPAPADAPADAQPRCAAIGEARSSVVSGLEAELLVLACGADLILNARILNRGNAPARINRMSLAFPMLAFEVREAGGTAVPGGPPPVPPADEPRWHLELAPNADYSWDAAVSDVVATTLPPGRYEIRLEYANATGPDWTGQLATGWVGFTVR